MTMQSTDNNITQENSKLLVAQNKCYELLYMPHRNRVYLHIFGFWKNRSQVPEYFPDLQKALALVQPGGFSLLLDLRTMITHPQAVMSKHIEVLGLLKEAGLRRAACVDPADRIASLQVNDTIDQSHLVTRRFTSYSEAEAWLNE
ncbi:hypothetical protein A3841_13210 [Pontibacter flavimaris]|uniref:STAS/SEC14 domain-containing protein n=2 Tax=Pontibacter flavimaris TaxID=1797110 RepID=A0A1Q5PF83_9BACT|nr:hypothetical protein A3841_13210 [Pontibacter flavimaris]